MYEQAIQYAVDKSSTLDLGNGALYSVVSIVMVFVILLIIIGVTTLVFKLTGLFAMKAELEALKKKQEAPASAPAPSKEVVVKDDDMMAAILVATIDYKKECKGDVRVVSVRELN